MRATILVVLTLAIGAAGCQPRVELPAQPTSTTEFRICEDLSAPGLMRTTFRDSLGERRLYLRPDVVLRGLDVRKVTVSEDEGGRFRITLTLTPAGTRVLGDATEANVGKRLAIIVDGEVIAAPVIREPMRASRCSITGLRDREHAESLARRIQASIPR
jgi:preprotein translocase subunit SecD